MFTLDIRTVVFSYVITNIVCTLVIFLLWLQDRKRFEGITFWLIDYAFQTIALIFIISRGHIPDLISMDLSNILVITGALLGLMGMERYIGQKGRHIHNYLLIGAFAFVHIWFTFIKPDLAVRNLNLSVALLVIFSQCAWLFLYRVPYSLHRLTRGIGIVFVAYSLVNVVRIAAFFTLSHPTNDYFHSSGFEAVVLLFFQILSILLTYSLTLLFNKRLLSDIAFQEEKFSKAFNSSPYVILLTRLLDGKILEVNNGFVNISGYQYSEILGKTTADLHFWENDKDRNSVVSELLSEMKVHQKEINFRKKSGELFNGLFSAEILNINNERCIISSINDITDRKQAIEAVMKSEKLYRSLFENMLNGFAYCKMHYDELSRPFDFTYLAVNSAFETQTGLMNVLGKKVSEVIPGITSADPKLIELYGRVASNGQPEQFEMFIESLKMWFWISVYSPGKGYFVAVFDVITDQKLTTLALKENEKKYRYLFEKNPQAMWIYDLETLAFLEVNNAAVTNYGYTKKEFLQLTLLDIRPKEDLELLLSDVANTTKPLNNAGIWRHKKKNGEIIFVEISSHLTDYENHKARLVLINDVTERIHAEEELKANYSLLRVAGKLAKFGGWSMDLSEEKITWSDEVAAIHGMPAGYSPELNEGINFYAPEWQEKITKAVNDCSEKGITYDEEMQIISAKSRIVWIRTIGEAIRDENGKIVKINGFFQDITERKKAAEEIRKLNEELEQRVIQRTSQLEAANRELEAFSYSVSHDLRAPLRSIHSFTKILKEDYNNLLDDEGKRIMGIVESSSIHMGQLIDDLLAFSRVGRTELLFSKIEMTALSKYVFLELTRPEERERIDFKVKKLPSAFGDPSAIKQVMTNLISNALKYSSKVDRASILIDYNLNDGEISYFIKDNGVGFDMQYVNKLFGVFQRLHSAKEFEGNGVGLAIVQRVVLRHGGRVWAKGEIGKGAAFYFSLPDKETSNKLKTTSNLTPNA